MKYIPGVYNTAANSLSCNPTEQPDEDDIQDIEDVEKYVLTSVNTADDVNEVARTDPKYQMLLDKVTSSTFATPQVCENVEIRNYFNVRDRLSIMDGLLLYYTSY